MIALLTIGSEILDGRVQDTNAHFMAGELAQVGLTVHHILSCDDDEAQIVDALRFLTKTNSTILISGGLGPTSDDLTREAVARLIAVDLLLDQPSLERIKEIFAHRKRSFDPTNAKQALFPRGSTVLVNTHGTASGFSIRLPADLIDETTGAATAPIDIFCMPGVPNELRLMFREQILPVLQKKHGIFRQASRCLRIFGLAEASVAGQIEKLRLPNELKISYRAAFPHIEVIYRHHDEKLLDEFIAKTRDAIGADLCFSDKIDYPLQSTVHDLLLSCGKTLALAESCTGGLISSLLTAHPGSSRYLLGAAVTYSNEAKTTVLEVPSDMLSVHGAVSHEVAAAMGRGAMARFKSDLAVSVTGIAGPDGGSADKPVGTYYVALAERIAGGRDMALHSYRFFYPGERTRVQTYAANMALDLLRRHLIALPPPTGALAIRSW